MINNQKGFALPTVLILSTILMIVATSILQTTISARQGIQNQYLNQLASEAIDSGSEFATYCLKQSNYSSTWSDTKPLTPATDCSGNTGTGVDYIYSGATIRSKFTVGGSVTGSGGQRFKINGIVETLQSGTFVQAVTNSSVGNAGSDLSINRIGLSYQAPDGASLFTVSSDKQLYGLGYNGSGILGNGTYTNRVTPVKYNLPAGVTVANIFVNNLSLGRNAMILGSNGVLYATGYNDYGQLGIGTSTSFANTPTPYLLPNGESVSSVTICGFSTFVVANSGNTYASGDGSYGRLGTGTTSNTNTPVRVAISTSEQIVKVACDGASSYFLTASGKVFGSGGNASGQLGNGNKTDQTSLVQFGTFGNGNVNKVADVVADGNSAWVQLTDGRVFGAGYAGLGQLGNGGGADVLVPVQFQMGSETAKAIYTDYRNVAVLTNSGKVMVSGENDSGELGRGNRANVLTPVAYSIPAGKTAKAVAISGSGDFADPYNDIYGDNIFVLTTDGLIYGSGDNYYGQLGLGYSSNPVLGVSAMTMPSNVTAKDIETGIGTFVVLGSDNLIYAVGNNNQGQLGNGNRNNSSTLTATRYLNIVPTVVF